MRLTASTASTASTSGGTPALAFTSRRRSMAVFSAFPELGWRTSTDVDCVDCVATRPGGPARGAPWPRRPFASTPPACHTRASMRFSQSVTFSGNPFNSLTSLTKWPRQGALAPSGLPRASGARRSWPHDPQLHTCKQPTSPGCASRSSNFFCESPSCSSSFLCTCRRQARHTGIARAWPP